MAKLTEYIISLIQKQVKEKGIVVWYDPERSYTDFVQTLSLPGTTLLHYTDSFFKLRNEIDPLVEFLGDEPVVLF